jgi:hypothetical protein
MIEIAALYVDPNGPYPSLTKVDCWDSKRDARGYNGPHPVVAHPPCKRWVNFAALNFRRYGGEHNRPGNDGGCFASALAAVRQWGGVLEHPAGSKAWSQFGLKRPTTGHWTKVAPTEWVCEVWQSAYGHAARKRTWLLYVSATVPPYEANWEQRPGTHQVGWFDRIKPTLGKRAAALTPPAFAKFLVQLARRSALNV